MNRYELLENEASENGIDVIDYDFRNDTIKGLYCNNTIAINRKLEISTEKACVLAEELGHHYTTVGNIIDLDTPYKRKQERQARLWAYNKLIGLSNLVGAYENGCSTKYEIADFLGVTEEFLEEAINCYREKYGICKNVGNYIVYFIPQLAVCKKI